MGRQSNTNRQMKASTSMLFGQGSVAGGDADESMSVDGAAENRTQRDGSVLVRRVHIPQAGGAHR